MWSWQVVVAFSGPCGEPSMTMLQHPQILTAAGVLSGKSAMCYPAVKPDVEGSGGTYVDRNNFV